MAYYRLLDYNAIALGAREAALGLDIWKEYADSGLPILAANLYSGRRPVFGSYIVVKENGVRLGVVGFLGSGSWKALPDTSGYRFKPLMDCRRILKKAAKRSDHLTVIGDLTVDEAVELIEFFPDIDLVLTPAMQSVGPPVRVGDSAILGAGKRGYNSQYVDWRFAAADSTDPLTVTWKTLDSSIDEDPRVARLVQDSAQAIKEAGKE